MTTTTTRTITVTKRDGSTKAVESPYTDDEVVARLQELTGFELASYGTESVVGWDGPLKSRFARDLAAQAEMHRGLSAKQIAWVHILVVEHEAPREQAAAVATLPRVRAMIDKASETLQYPKLNFQMDDGQRVRLSRAGEQSNSPGAINITDGKPFGENAFFGRIDLDGNVRPARAMTPEVLDFLVAFDADPAASATAYGRRTGNCCFCHRELTDGRSVAMGYGPICAGHYGLPWGDERVPSTVEVGDEGDGEGCGCTPRLMCHEHGSEFYDNSNDPESPEARAAGRGL